MSGKKMTTRERIVEVAGEIFGMEGFKAATIRKIADAADANVASINYYFRDKEGLYAEVIEEIFSSGFRKFPSNMDIYPESSPEEKLKAFVRGMFLRLMSRDGWGGMAGKGRLLAKEILDPTPVFEKTIVKYIKPHKELLMSILAELTAPDIPEERLHLCALSVVSQCLYYAFATPVIQHVASQFVPVEDNLDKLAEHVWLFSLGGIRNLKREFASESTK